MSDPLVVSGGAAGVEVQYAALQRTAGSMARAGAGLLGLAAIRHRFLADGDLLASAVLHPAGFARVEAALLDALDGPRGVAAAGARLEVRAGQLAVAVVRYEAVDHLEGELAELRPWLLVASAPVLLPLGAGYVGARVLDVVAEGGDPVAELERLLTEHPGVVDDVVDVAGLVTTTVRDGLLGPLPVLGDQVFEAVTGDTLLPDGVAGSAGLLALLYGSQAPTVGTARPDDDADAVLVPGGVGDLMSRLHHRNTSSPAGTPDQGDIGVTRITTTGPDGRPLVSLVVDIPGTKDWQLTPLADRPYVNDLATNLELTAGIDNARLVALAEVLRREKALHPDAPVMLVGHSQGGILAMRAAQELAARFDITHVVTAGSPVAGIDAPPGTQVLSLENAHDVVPHLDGADNAGGAEHTTVVFDRQNGGTVLNHDTDAAYADGARELDLEVSKGRADSVQVWLDSAAEFLAGRGEQTTAQTVVYPVTGSAGRR